MMCRNESRLSLEKNVWALTPGPRGDKWTTFHTSGIASIGHDLEKEQDPDRETLIQTIDERVEGKYKGQYQAYLFQECIEAGDLIVAKRGSQIDPNTVYGIGQVTEPYDPLEPLKLESLNVYEPKKTDHYKHQIRLDWFPIADDGINFDPNIMQFPGQTLARLSSEEFVSLLNILENKLSETNNGEEMKNLLSFLNIDDMG